MWKTKFRSALAFLSVAMLVNASVLPSFASSENDLAAAAASFGEWRVVGPTGGDVRVVEIDPRDKDRLYVSTLDGQIHTSGDGGKTWRLLANLNKPELILDQLLVDSQDSRILYTSGHRGSGPGAFFRSTDGGVTWKESKELKNESIHAMTQSPIDPTMLFVGTTRGVWMSKNRGADWEKISSPTMPVNIDSLAIDPRTNNTIFAGTFWRAYKSTDAGKSWRLIKDGMIDDSDVFAISIDPRNPDYVIASACSGIYESQNAGEKWRKIQGIPSQSRRTRDIVQHPSVPTTIYAGTTEGFWMSVNGGKTWALTTQRQLEVNSIAVHPSEPNRVFIGTNNNGVMVSEDSGRSFRQTNQNFSSRFTYMVTPDVEQSNRLYAATHNTATGGGFFFVSDDGGTNWLPARGLDTTRIRTYAIRQDASDPKTMYLGTNIGVFRSLDRGSSWTPMVATVKAPVKKAPVRKAPVKKAPPKKGVKKTASTAPIVPPTSKVAPAPVAALIPAIKEKVTVIEIMPGGGLLAGTDKGLYRSLDVAKGWEKLSFGEGLSNNVYAIHVSPARPDTIWAGTATTGVVVSRDKGLTWNRVGGAVSNVPVSSIASDPKRPDNIYVGTIQTFYLSRDNGKTWTRRGGNLPLGNFTSILINPNNTNEILLSSAIDTDGGVYISTDAGDRWKRVDTQDMKLPSRRIWSMAFDPNDPDRIFAATHSSGVYKIERATKTSAGL